MEYNTTDGETIKTGNLVTISSMSENNEVLWHMRNLTIDPNTGSLYYPYGFIGLRNICNGCPRKWPDGSPVVFENWYGSDPNTWYYECTEIYLTDF